MPYIKEEDRQKLDKIWDIEPQNAGELNYLFTVLIKQFLGNQGISYQKFNDAVGALEGCKLELYRKHIVEYENEKMLLNGDV